MGWLFALALGLQDKRRSAVLEALLPIALGHAVAIATAILFLIFLQHLFPTNVLKWVVAVIIFALGTYRLFRARHPRGAGMRVGPRDLFSWSFLMASSHGAGLMLMPVLMASPRPGMSHAMHGLVHVDGRPLGTTFVLLSVLVHTVAMLAVAGVLALFFFEAYNKVGLKVLQHTWFNFDLLWASALLIAAIGVLLP
jgi:hypothetical protein